MTTNLNITDIAASQNQKHITINEGLDALDRASNSLLSFTVTGNFTMTTAQFTRNIAFILSGTPAADFIMTVPSTARMFIVRNLSGRVASVKTSPGTAVLISSGRTYILVCDGTNIFIQDQTQVEINRFFPGRPLNSQRVLGYIATGRISLPVGLALSRFVASVAATASTTFNISRNGTNIGTLVWAAAGTIPTVTFTTATVFVAGDILLITGPASADATLADISFSIVGDV